MQTAFFGTPPAAVPSLETLAAETEIRFVVTRPDRPRGRSGRPRPSAVKEAARRLDLPVFQPDEPDELADRAAELEAAVVTAYGKIIKPALLSAPRKGFVNVHFSLLPRWRGAAPVARTILAGDAHTGVTLIEMDEGLDTGPILSRVETPIDPQESAGRLTERLSLLGADLLGATLAPYVRGEITPLPQPEDGATSAPKVDPAEARIDPARPAEEVVRAVRAFSPAPGAWGEVEGKRFRVLGAVEAASLPDLPPGRIELVGGALLMGTGTGVVQLTVVQQAGRSVMSGGAWGNGRRGEPATLS